MKKTLLAVLPLVVAVAASIASADTTVVPLIANKTTIVGSVTISHVTSTIWDPSPDFVTELVVTYATTGNWRLVDTHLQAAATIADIPQTKKGNPKPGKFDPDTCARHEPPVTTYTYTIPLTTIASGDPVYIAAHARVADIASEAWLVDDTTDDAWGEGQDFPGKNWAMYISHIIPPPTITLVINSSILIDGYRFIAVPPLECEATVTAGGSPASGVDVRFEIEAFDGSIIGPTTTVEQTNSSGVVMADFLPFPGTNGVVTATVVGIEPPLFDSEMFVVWSGPTVPASADLGAPTSDVSGFSIRSLAPLVTDGWDYDAMNSLIDTGTWMGLPAQPGTEGTRVDEFVNLRDTGNGVFSEANGYPDASYPGIDPLEIPAQDPAAGDDDDYFATEILGCIQLTAGMHIIGVNSDEGTIIEIGGIEIGRTEEWKETSNVDFFFQIEADGYYDLRARTMEGSGDSSMELHEVMPDFTRILLNDVAKGGSEVFAPAP